MLQPMTDERMQSNLTVSGIINGRADDSEKDAELLVGSIG